MNEKEDLNEELGNDLNGTENVEQKTWTLADELNSQEGAMPQDSNNKVWTLADELNAGNAAEDPQKRLSDRLDLSDKLEKMASFVADETDGDDNYKDDHDFAVRARDILSTHKTNFAKLSDEDVGILASDIQSRYDAASKRRGRLEIAADAFKRGHASLMGMMVQGIKAFEPEMTQEDAEIIRGAQKNADDAELLAPKKAGGIENIKSLGDYIDYALETAGENLERMAVGAAGAIVGGAVGGPVGAMIGSGLFTLAANTGEAVSDQLQENRGDGDIRNSRGYAIAQGVGYSILDGAFGIDKMAGRVWGSMLAKGAKKILPKQLIKGATVDAIGKQAAKATVKGAAKEFGKDVLLEGVQEAAQSQGVGRAVRYFQTGSIFRKNEDGTYETPGDAFLEAANEFAGGATAALSFGLLGGGSSIVDARRANRIAHETQGALRDDSTYQKLSEYSKLLVDRHVQNDRFLETTGFITDEVKDSLRKSNAEIEAEIARMAEDGTDAEKLDAQSADAYLKIFKSQYSFEDMGEVVDKMRSDGRESDLSLENMEKSAQEVVNDDGSRYMVYTDKGISIAEMLDADGKPTGKYIYNNDPKMKSPIVGSNELVCGSFEEAFSKAKDLDLYNQWRAEKLRPKAELIEKVFYNMFGNRGVKLDFVDRPTKGSPYTEPEYSYDQKTGKVKQIGTKIVAGSPAAYVMDNNGGPGTVEISLDNIDSIGSLYTVLAHERSHSDIVDFLLKTGRFMTDRGFDKEAFDAAREELMSKVAGAEEISGKFRKDGAKSGKNGKYSENDVTFDWGRSAGTAGEELVAEQNSVYDVMDRIRREEQGAFGSLIERVRNAIGMRMAADMGLDIRTMIPTMNKDVAAEINKIFELNYPGVPAPKGFSRVKNPERRVEDNEHIIMTPDKFKASLGKKVSGANSADVINLGDNPTPTEGSENIPVESTAPAPTTQKPTTNAPSVPKTRTLKPQMSDGDGASYANGKVIRRADGAAFTKVSNPDGSYVWRGVDGDVSDSVATEGGFDDGETPSKPAPAPTAKPTPEPAPKPASPETSEKAPESSPSETTTTSAEAVAKPVESKESATEAEKTASKTKGKPKATKKTAKKAEKKPEEAEKQETAAPAAKQKEPASPVESSAAPTQSDEKPASAASVKTDAVKPANETKPVESAHRAPEASPSAEPVRANPDGTLTVEQNAKPSEKREETPSVKDDILNLSPELEKSVNEMNEALDKEPSLSYVTKEQRNGMRKLVAKRKSEIVDVDPLGKSKCICVTFADGRKKGLNPDGSVMTIDQIKDIPVEGSPDENVSRSLHSRIKWIFSLPNVKNLKTEDIPNGTKYSGLSENRLLKLATEKKDLRALRVMFWSKFEKNPPKGRKSMSEWFAEKGFDRDEIQDKVVRVWNRIVEEWSQDGSARLASVPTEAFVYAVANRVVVDDERIAENRRRIEEAEAKNNDKSNASVKSDTMDEDDWLRSRVENISFADARKERIADESVVIPEAYKKMSISKLAELCFTHDGINADKFARFEFKIRAQEHVLKNANKIIREYGIPSSYLDEIIDNVNKALDKDFANIEKKKIYSFADDKGYDESVEQEEDEIVFDEEAGEENDETLNRRKTKKRSADDKFHSFVNSYIRNFANRARTEWAKLHEVSQDEREEKAGNAAEAMIDEDESFSQSGHSEEGDENVGYSLPSVEFDTPSDSEIRAELGQFDSARDAAIALMNSGELSDTQRNILKALVNAWGKQISDIWERIEALREDEKNGTRHTTAIKALKERLKQALNLESNDRSTLEIAAAYIGMRPKVYAARLAELMDNIEWNFVGEANFRTARANVRAVHEPGKLVKVNGKNVVTPGRVKGFYNFLPDGRMVGPDGKKGKNWPFVNRRTRLREGRLTPRNLSSGLAGIGTGDLLGSNNYDSESLVNYMIYNRDEAMANAVALAHEGMTNDEIDKVANSRVFFDKDGNPVENYSDFKTAKALLEHAYKEYGWIDPRIGRYSARAKKRIIKQILSEFGDLDLSAPTETEIANAVDRLRNDGNTSVTAETIKSSPAMLADVAFNSGRYNNLGIADRVRVWLWNVGIDVGVIENKYAKTDASGRNVDISESELPGLVGDGIVSLLKESRSIGNTVNETYSAKQRKDYERIERMLAENGGDESAVRKALSGEGNADERIDQMFARHNKIKERNEENEAKRKEREEERLKTGSALTESQKDEIRAILERNDWDMDSSNEDIEEMGLSEKLTRSAKDHARYLAQKNAKSNEEAIENASYETKRSLLVDLLSKTGDDYVSNDEAIDYAVNTLKMSRFSAKNVVKAKRPALSNREAVDKVIEERKAGMPTENTDDWLANRSESLGENGLLTKSKFNAINAKLEKEDVENARKAVTKTAEADHIRVMKYIDKNGGDKNGVLGMMRKDGLSESRIISMLNHYMDVENARKAIEEAEKKNDAKKNDEDSETDRRLHSRTIVFSVNGVPPYNDVEADGENLGKILNKAIFKAALGKRYNIPKVSLEIKTIDGRSVPLKVQEKFGIITTETRNDRQRLRILENAVESWAGQYDGIRSNDDSVRGENATSVPKVAEGSRRNGRGRDLGEGNRDNEQYGRWFRLNGVERSTDAEETQEFRNEIDIGGRRWHSRMSADDNDAVFATQEGMKARGFDVGPRPRKLDATNDANADYLISRPDKFEEVVRKGLDFEALSDVEMRALAKNFNERVANSITSHLTDEEFEANEKRLDTLATAINRAGSKLGAALRQLQIGLDLRTRDDRVYLKAAVRSKFEKEIEKKYGTAAVVERSHEIEAKIKELEEIIDRQADELQKRHDIIDEQNRKIKDLTDKADDRSFDNAVKAAWREGHDIGVRETTEAEKNRRAKELDKLVSEYGANAKKASRGSSAAESLGDLFGGGDRRFAGNPKVGLDDRARAAFAAVVDMFDGDAEKARRYLSDKYEKFASDIEPFFNAYLAEVNSESAPKDGTTVTKEKNRKRIISKRAETFADVDPDEIDMVDVIGDDVNGGVRVKATNKNAADYISRLKKRFGRAFEGARMSSDEAEKLAHIGELARIALKASAIAEPGKSREYYMGRVARAMNDANGSGENVFTAEDARNAVLGIGAFKPIPRERAKATVAQLKEALKLAQSGKVAEAAKNANIEYSSDSQILQELDNRIGRLLDRNLDLFSSRINEKPDAKLESDISKLINALKDISTSGKPVKELLEKYIGFAIGMKDYRRQRGVLERIQSRIDMYERKLEENDFEAAPKRENPDISGEVKKIASAKRDLERLRERFKHERDLWQIAKKPFFARQWATLSEILGETKAIVGSFDLSSMLRQGGQLSWAHPILFSKNFKKTMRALKSDENAKALMDSIFERQNAKYYVKAGIDFTDWGSNAANSEDLWLLNKYRFVTKMKLMRIGIESSERAFSMFLNLMRADVFDAMVANSPMRSADRFSDQQLKAIGNFINIASQRGCIDQTSKLGKSISFLNTFMWSPRNFISRLQFMWETAFLPFHGMASAYGADAHDAMMRKMFAKETLRYMTGVAIGIFFVKMMADLFRDDDEPQEDIVLDPRSSDFLKVKVGNTRLDFLSGLQQAFVFSCRLATGKTTNLRGETKELNRYEAFGRFLRSKFSPAASIIYDTTIARETFEHQEMSFSLNDQLKNDPDKIGVTRYLFGSLFAPLSIADLREQAKYGKLEFLPLSWIFTVLGAGVQSFDPYTYRQMYGDYKFYRRLYKDAETQDERDDLVKRYPMLKRMGAIESMTKEVGRIERQLKKMDKAGINSPELEDLLEKSKKRAINLMAGFKDPMNVD